MQRGGKREGAGRKPIDESKRRKIAAHYERLWREECQAKLDAEMGEAIKNVQNERNLVRRESGLPDDAPVRISNADLADALRLDQGLTEDQEPTRLIQVKAKRPWGVRKGIQKKVAEAEGVSERMVERCVKEFRRLRNDLES
jgi:hypothetical protein